MNRIYHDAFEVLEIEMIYGRAGLKEIGNFCGLNLGYPRYPMSTVLSGETRRNILRRLENWWFSRPFVIGRSAANVGPDGEP